MYIISKFHDYYDTAAVYGIDKTVIFKREAVEQKIERRRWNGGGYDTIGIGEDHMTRDGKVVVEEFLIGFCGKVYPGVRFTCGDKTVCVYDATQFFIEAVDFNLHVDWKAKKSTWSRILYYRGGINAGHVKAYFERDWTKELESKFVELHSPIFSVSSVGYNVWLTKNPNLKRFQFMKVFDAPTAFQNIFMYLSGVLGAPKPPKEEPSDKIKAANHGHDGEYSFKKPPGGKRWR